MAKNKVDFIGIGNAITDIQALVSDEDLIKLNISKGIMSLVDFDSYTKLEKIVHSREIKLAGGGSVANTSYALQKLGANCAFIGQLGDDAQGKFYTQELQRVGIDILVKPTTGRSGACVVLITPDAQRTLNTYLGVSIKLKEIHYDLPVAKYFMIEGYLFDCPEVLSLLDKIIPKLKKGGTKIILSCSDPFCIDRHREKFLNFIQKYCDIVISNDLEAEHFFGTSDPEFILSNSSQFCETFVVTRGAKGSDYFGPNSEYFHENAISVNALDTTGAGDYFAAGFIWGLLNDFNPKECLKLGNVAASQIICVYGARLEQINL